MLVCLESFLSNFTCFSEKVSVLLLYLLHAVDLLHPFSDNMNDTNEGSVSRLHMTTPGLTPIGTAGEMLVMFTLSPRWTLSTISLWAKGCHHEACPASIFSGDPRSLIICLSENTRQPWLCTTLVGQQAHLQAQWPDGHLYQDSVGAHRTLEGGPHTPLESARTSWSSAWHGWWWADCLFWIQFSYSMHWMDLLESDVLRLSPVLIKDLVDSHVNS